jgi:non-lysosomal glucosylceramidase
LQFKNSGRVRREMQFRYFDQPLAYAEDSGHWNTIGKAQYLYQVEGGSKIAPPTGMRSAVPLGGLGSGSVELRADGSLRDWEIFNNSPAGAAPIQIDDAFFGLWAKPHGQPSRALTLRTHPPATLPPISQIDYAGAFPVSRLRFSDSQIPLTVELYGYSEFHPFDAERSCTPCALFSFNLQNPALEAVEISLLFNLRNQIGGRAIDHPHLTFEKRGTQPTSGTLAVKVAGERVSITRAVSSDLAALWNEFSAGGEFHDASSRDEAPEYGALAAKAVLLPGEWRTITFVLAWYLPHRPYKGQVPGNNYTNLYHNADDVAEKVASRLDSTQATISTWQQTMFNNSLPDWLQDAMVNSVATMLKTGLWFQNGSFRQWESFSCAGLNPGHIDFYRILPYAFFFPSLHKQLLLSHAESQNTEGFIPEQLTTGCFAPDSELGHPGGRVMGDSETVFILWAWQIYSWTGDRQFLDGVWANVKRAADWQIERSTKFGLPEKCENTYDWWKFGEKDLVAYNAFLHLAAMLAAEKIAKVEGEAALAKQYHQAFEAGQKSLGDHLWTGEYYRAWWMDAKPYPDALHADTLYGQLWACMLDLGLTADQSSLKRHLQMESSLNASPFGLKVMRRADPEKPEAENAVPPQGGLGAARDNLVWEAGSLDWCSLSLYLGEPVESSLVEASKIVQNWADRLRDQWNYTDLTTAWDGSPWCNSHYARQVILWSIPLALSGQQYFAPEGRLTFDPRIAAPAQLPFFTPAAFGTVQLLEDGHYKLTVDFGTLELRELRVAKAVLRQSVTLRAGESATLHE